MDNCPICEKNVLQHEKILFCSCCCKYTHRNCSGLSKAQYEYVRFDTSWYCKKCIEDIIPFNHIDDKCIFLRAISEISVNSDIIVRYHSECKIFNPFEINEDDSNILEYHGDLDPDKCFFNQHSHSLLKACNYQTEQTFNNYASRKDISNNNFSLFHLNIRSVPANLSSLSGVPDFFDRNKILSGGDLSHYQVPHCIRVFFSFVWFVFIHHNFQFYFELCTYCNILDIYLS